MSVRGFALLALVGLPCCALGVFLEGCQNPARSRVSSSTGAADGPDLADQNRPADLEMERWLKPPPPDQAQPRLVCAEPTIDLDVMWCGRPYTVGWDIANEGAAPLHLWLHDARDFGHTRILEPRRTMPPGSRARIKLSPCLERPGHTEVSLPLVCAHSNDRFHGTLKLGFRARALSAVRVGDSRGSSHVLDFGELPRDAGRLIRTLTFQRGDGDPLHPRVIVVEPDPTVSDQSEPFDVSTELREIEPGTEYELDVTIQPPWPNHALRGRVRLATGVEQQPEWEVQVRADFRPRLSARWSSSPIPAVRKESCVGRIRLTWSPEAPPRRIVDIIIPTEKMTVDLAEQDGVFMLIVHVAPDCPPPGRAETYSIILKTDDLAVPKLSVPIHFLPEPMDTDEEN